MFHAIEKSRKDKDFSITEEEITELAQLIDESHTDRIDASAEECIYNYRFLRDPETDHTIVCYVNPYEMEGEFFITHITVDEITEILKDIEDGLFKFIDEQPKEIEITPNNVADYAFSIDQYNSYFTELLLYSYPPTVLTLTELINILKERGE